MDRYLVIACLLCVVLVGCGDSSTARQTSSGIGTTSEVRSIVLRSHLFGDLDSEPQLSKGEHIRLSPDPSEPFTSHDDLEIHLPGETPYDGEDEIYFLRGYAVGQSSFKNGQPVCHSNTSAARQHESWNKGWVTGFNARKAESNGATNRASLKSNEDSAG